MKLDKTYETGVVWQDFQHRQLIDLFEKIKQARSSKKDKDLYRYTLAFLAMYVNHHFKLEQEYMRKYDYPDRDVHQDEHKAFVKELREFKAGNTDYSEAAIDDLLTRMADWIMSHILENDKKLGKFILSMEQKKTAH